MDVDYTEFRDLEEAIQALTERVEELEKPKKPITITSHWETGSSPPTGLVLNDGKAEPDLSQRPPFVTGLSVLDSPKK